MGNENVKKHLNNMSYLRSGGKLKCPLCNKGYISMVNAAVFKCDYCNRGIISKININDDLIKKK